MTINFPHLPYFTLILLPWFDQNEIAAKVIEIAAWRFFPEIRVWGAFGDAVSRFTISQNVSTAISTTFIHHSAGLLLSVRLSVCLSLVYWLSSTLFFSHPFNVKFDTIKFWDDSTIRFTFYQSPRCAFPDVFIFFTINKIYGKRWFGHAYDSRPKRCLSYQSFLFRQKLKIVNN